RSALALMLGGQPDLTIVGEAADGREGVTLAGTLGPDGVLLDIRMPGMDGLAATAAIHARPHPPRVIVLTPVDADDYVFAAVAAGAAAFLLKHTAPAQIVDALRTVAGGEPLLSPSVAQTLIRRVRADADADPRAADAEARLESLTQREREVAVAVGRGLSN